MSMKIYLGSAACLVSLVACAPEKFVDPIGRTAAGGDVLAQDFGVATASNIQMQNIKAQRELVMNLTRIFAAEAPATINFDFNKSTLDSTAQAQLRIQAEWMKSHPNITFRVFGHTDKVGSNAYNRRLGLRRAQAAVNFLVAQGVPREKVDAVVSHGETRPLVLTESRNRENRRTVTEVQGFYRPGNAPIDGKYALAIYNRYVTEQVLLKNSIRRAYDQPSSNKGEGVVNKSSGAGPSAPAPTGG